MCLSRLLQIDEISADGTRASGWDGGRRTEVSLAVLALEGDPPFPGDWVLVATGLAVHRLGAEEAAAIATARTALWEEPT